VIGLEKLHNVGLHAAEVVVIVIVVVALQGQLEGNFGFSGRNFSRIDNLHKVVDQADVVAG